METFLIGINPSLLFTVDGRGLKKLESISRTVPTRQRDKIIPHKVLNTRRNRQQKYSTELSIFKHIFNLHFDNKTCRTIIKRCNIMIYAGCKENHFYSLSFGQAEASVY